MTQKSGKKCRFAKVSRSDGAYVQVNALALEPDIPMAREMARDFVRNVLELLPEYWTEEV